MDQEKPKRVRKTKAEKLLAAAKWNLDHAKFTSTQHLWRGIIEGIKVATGDEWTVVRGNMIGAIRSKPSLGVGLETQLMAREALAKGRFEKLVKAIVKDAAKDATSPANAAAASGNAEGQWTLGSLMADLASSVGKKKAR